MDFMLRTTNLCKNFKEQTAVDHVSLHIPRNSVYGLLGPNGAGKSTILKMITGILRPTSGEILFDGHPWSRKDLTHIGALIETPPLYENLSAYENLKAKTLALGLPDSRIREVLEVVQLTNQVERSEMENSGANFKVNLLSIGFGLSFYIPTSNIKFKSDRK